MRSPDLQRISSMLDYCDEIAKTINRYGKDYEIFDNDADYQRSISFSILQIGELSGGLSQEYRAATSDQMKWHAMKGMRNMVAHSYGNMSREIIWETAIKNIPELAEFCRNQLLEEV